MSRPGRYQSGVAYALALLLAITGFAGLVGFTTSSAAAQDGSDVLVACAQPLGTSSTECVVSAPGADQISVPANNVCAAFTSTTGVFDGDSYVSPAGSPSVSFSFPGQVVIVEGGSYVISRSGSSATVTGNSIVCAEIDLPAEEPAGVEPPASTETAPEPSGDIGGGTTDSGSGAEAGTDAATATNGTDTEIEPAAVIVDPETTPESGIPAEPVRVSIVAYQCDVDPGATDPLTAGCSLAAGLVFGASDSDGSLGTATTDSNGAAGFDSTAGNTFIVYQSTMINGYRPTGDGRFEVQQLTGDLTLNFINVVRAELGRLQVVAGLCPTSTESRTEFTIADQSHFGTASLDACGPNPGAVFTLTSDALPGGSMTVRMEADGAWRGHVPAGTYTVTATDGTVSAPIVVIANAVSVAVAVTYVHQEQGTLELQHVFCSAGTDGEYISVNPAGPADASCAPAQATLSVSDELNGGGATSILVAANGSTSVALKPGLYRVTGPNGVASDLVTITAEQTSVVRVSTVSTTGSLMVYGFQCPSGTTSAPLNPAATCSTAYGPQQLTIDGPGEAQTVSTSNGGLATINGLVPGSYSVTGATVCSVRSGDGADASTIAIAAGQTAIVYVYNCLPTDGTSGGGQTGGGTSGPGDGTGGGNGPTIGGSTGTPGDGTNPGQYTGGVGGDGPDVDGTGGSGLLGSYASNSNLLVRGLPSAGSGSSTGPADFWWPILMIVGAFALTIIGRRQHVLAQSKARSGRGR
jgi:hypothetical protein